MTDDPQQPSTAIARRFATRHPERGDLGSGELRGADEVVNCQAWTAGTWPEFGLP